MPSLPTNLRKQLESTIIAARDKAEEAAFSALQKLAIDAAEPFSHFTAEDKQLRDRLRARARQAGDELKDKIQSIELLTQVATLLWRCSSDWFHFEWLKKDSMKQPLLMR